MITTKTHPDPDAAIHSPSYYVNFAAQPTAKEYIDWHVQGCAAVHQDTGLDPLINQLAAALPELSSSAFEITITGYIHMTEPVSPGTYGKSKDSRGRNIFVVGKRLIFQRYVEGNRYMATETWEVGGSRRFDYDPVTEDQWPALIAEASKRPLGK